MEDINVNSQDPINKTKILYDAVSKDYNVGSFDEFSKKLQDPSKREAFYKGVGSEYNLGSYDEFSKKIGLVEKKNLGGTLSPTELPASLPSQLPKRLNVDVLAYADDGQKAAAPQPTTITEKLFGNVRPEKQKLDVTPKVRNVEKEIEAEQTGKKITSDAINNTVKAYKDRLSGDGAYKISDTDPALINQKNDLEKDLKEGNLQVVKSQKTGQYILARKNGALQSISQAYNNVKEKEADDKYVASLSTIDKIKHFDNKAALVKDEYLPSQPSGFGGAFGTLIGENATPLVKMGAMATAAGKVGEYLGLTGTALANAEKFGSFLAFANDAGYSGYSNNTEKVYNALRKQNPNGDKIDQMQRAERAGLVGEVSGIATAGAMTGAFAKLTNAAKNVNVQPLVSSLEQLAHHTVKESAIQGGFAAGGSLVSDLGAISQGVKMKPSEVVGNAFEAGKGMAEFTSVMGSAMGIVAGLANVPKYVKAQATGTLAKLDPVLVNDAYKEAEANGALDPGTAEKAMQQINGFKEAKNKVPTDLPDENVNAIAGIQQKIDKLEAQKKTLAPQFHDRIDAVIDSLRNRSKEIASTDKPLEKEVDDITQQPTNVRIEPAVEEKPIDIKVGDEVNVTAADGTILGEKTKVTAISPDNKFIQTELGNAYVPAEQIELPKAKEEVKPTEVKDGFDYVRNKFMKDGSGGKRLSDKESNILNKEVDKLIERAEKENGVKRNELKQSTWKTNDGYTINEFFENGRGGTRVITPKGEEINLFDNKYKGESGKDISYFPKAHEEVKPTEVKETAKLLENKIKENSSAFDKIKDKISKFSLNDIKEFFHASESKRIGKLKKGEAAQFGEGIYFSTDKDTVKDNFGEEVTNVLLNIENPVFTNTKEWNKVEDLALKMANEGKRIDEDGYIEGGETDIAEIKPKFISNAAKELGYDAIVDKNSQHGNEISVIDDSKIIYEEDLPKAIAEAYHKAKIDGNNPELVKSVEEQLKPKEKVKNEVEVFHGGTIDKPEDLAEGEPLFVSESKSQAKEYTKENEGKVKGFKIDKNKIATEEEARDVIKKLDLKPKEEGWDAEELNLFELIDPKFETSLSEDDIQKVFNELKKKGYEGVSFMDTNLKTLKQDIQNIAIFDPKETLFKEKPKENAIQKPSTGEVLQREPKTTRIEGGERGRVEPSKQGEAIAEKGKQVEGNEEEVKPKEYTSKTGRQKIVYDEKGNSKVIDTKTGKEVSRETAKKVYNEAADNYDFSKGKKASFEGAELKDEREVENYTIDNSSNPAEIAEVYARQELEPPSLNSAEAAIVNHGIGKVDVKSFKRFNDENNITFGLAKNWFQKGGKGSKLDAIAEEISAKTGVNVTPEDIGNFMVRFPSGARAEKLVENDIAYNARNKFEKLTGLPLTEEIAHKAIDYEFNKLTKEQQAIAEQDSKTRKQLEDAYWAEQPGAIKPAPEKGNNIAAKQARKAEKGLKEPIVEKKPLEGIQQEYQEVINKTGEKVREKAKLEFVERNFDSILDKLKEKIKEKCPT